MPDTQVLGEAVSERKASPLLEWMPVLQTWAHKEPHQGKEYLVWPDVQVCFKKAWNSVFSVKFNFFQIVIYRQEKPTILWFHVYVESFKKTKKDINELISKMEIDSQT